MLSLASLGMIFMLIFSVTGYLFVDYWIYRYWKYVLNSTRDPGNSISGSLIGALKAIGFTIWIGFIVISPIVYTAAIGIWGYYHVPPLLVGGG